MLQHSTGGTKEADICFRADSGSTEKQGYFGSYRTDIGNAGVKDTVSVLKPVRGDKRPERDIAVCIPVNLGVCTHNETGSVFGSDIREPPATIHPAVYADSSGLPTGVSVC